MSQSPATGTDFQVAICGSAGDGTIAAGDILKRAMAKAGYQVIAFDLYPAEIRGFGKCIARTRITSQQVYALKPQSDVLISLDDHHAIPHVEEVRDYGAVIYDDAPVSEVEEGGHISRHVSPAQLPYGAPFRELSERTTSGAKSRNMVAVGYLAGLFRMPRAICHETIGNKFKTKPAALIDANMAAFDAGYETGAAVFREDFVFLGQPPRRGGQGDLVMMSGNDAIVRGCLDAGIQTFFGYPITPATTIMEKLAVEMPKRGGRLLQTEDEISAVAATLGAGYAGVRTATATSGPGLALMTEMLGLGAMAEVPTVVIVSQRGGPSTGMPTKTEQSDLHLAVFGVAGDGQRIVLAPTNVEGCYKCVGKAFEMAERYQTPVIVLLDLYLSNRYEAVVLPHESPFEPNSSKGVAKRRKRTLYERYAITDDWVSPRAVPGDAGCQHVATGLEHNQRGRPSDQPEVHNRMSRKRHEKLKAALMHSDINITKRFGDAGKVDLGFLGWGSSFGEILEAMFEVRKTGVRCAAMRVIMLSPFPSDEVAAFMDDCKQVMVPELNYEGQFANLVGAALGRPVIRFNRVPGSPMRVEGLLAEIRRLTETPTPVEEHA